MKPDPSYEEYVVKFAEIYEKNNYDQGLAGYFLSKSHEWSEQAFGPEIHFPKVLEVGAGTGVHLRSVRHSFEEYWLTDFSQNMLDTLKVPENTTGKVVRKQENATALSFPDATFDRLIAAHVLEHLYRPHEVLREWARVLKPGGTLSLLLPCDPGVGWRLGRYLSARKRGMESGIDYDYWMAREHVNPINCLVSFVRHYFTDVREEWRPFRIPSMDINLFYIAHVRV